MLNLFQHRYNIQQVPKQVLNDLITKDINKTLAR
jgi:hypothetical protein